MKEYKHIQADYKAGGMASCCLDKPINCDLDWFVHAFWMPMKHQIGDKLVFCPSYTDNSHFQLFYNQMAAIGDVDFPTKEQIDFCAKDSERVMELALTHIDHILDYIYYEESVKDGVSDIVPFIGKNPIRAIRDNSIIMNGRLPMQEDYFIKNYWKPISKTYHDAHKGKRFKIHFSENGTVISVTAECCQDNARRTRHGLPLHDNNSVCAHIIGQITCDLADAVISAANEYIDAKAKYQRKRQAM